MKIFIQFFSKKNIEALPRNYILEYFGIIRNYQKKHNAIVFGEMFNELILDKFIDNFDAINTINDLSLNIIYFFLKIFIQILFLNWLCTSYKLSKN